MSDPGKPDSELIKEKRRYLELNGPSLEVAKRTAEITWWNNVGACFLSIVMCIVANYAIMKVKTISTYMKAVYIFFKGLEVAFNIFFVIACPIFVAVETSDNFLGLMIVNCGIKLPSTLSMISLMLSIFLLTQLIFMPPIVYWIRYHQICRKGVRLPHVLTMTGLNIFLLILSAGVFCYASSTTIEDIIVLSGIAVSFASHETVFLVLSYDKIGSSMSAYVSSVTYFLILVFAVVIMGFSHLEINKKIRSNVNMSENLKKMQRRANRILTSQFALTIFFIQLPFFYSVLGPVVGVSEKLATYLVSILFVWGPVANTLTLVAFKTQIRQWICSCSTEPESTEMNVVDRSNMKSEMR
uniref:G_PROTEIN_RECEP_F1_2 domain-containing protein n=1 Tax=Caenorhabditis tropicalis TaxID=1561998 RepID=A0A1I7UVZ8_9PELO